MSVSVIPNTFYRHKSSGRKASFYGAGPWASAAEKDQWEIVTDGFTWKDDWSGTIGLSRPPAATKEDAESIAHAINAARAQWAEESAALRKAQDKEEESSRGKRAFDLLPPRGGYRIGTIQTPPNPEDSDTPTIFALELRRKGKGVAVYAKPADIPGAIWDAITGSLRRDMRARDIREYLDSVFESGVTWTECNLP